ncbi:hypothetical protein OUZ56_030775 [Daphnia magna]|uniref:Uncharacterized protein n=1 Tax=Daphnia magna TaxID=35525 RepID=A0ABQ9ZS94_9CRUS|nr:hypothetical protein OUZ56_030775 [Daphnia magna]
MFVMTSVGFSQRSCSIRIIDEAIKMITFYVWNLSFSWIFQIPDSGGADFVHVVHAEELPRDSYMAGHHGDIPKGGGGMCSMTFSRKKKEKWISNRTQ